MKMSQRNGGCMAREDAEVEAHAKACVGARQGPEQPSSAFSRLYPTTSHEPPAHRTLICAKYHCSCTDRPPWTRQCSYMKSRRSSTPPSLVSLNLAFASNDVKTFQACTSPRATGTDPGPCSATGVHCLVPVGSTSPLIHHHQMWRRAESGGSTFCACFEKIRGRRYHVDMVN